jgi:hypothetical protein
MKTETQKILSLAEAALQVIRESSAPKKYEFTDKITHVGSVTLKQIKRISDGKVGGFIEKEENLSHMNTCFVYDEACVYGEAHVSGDAEITDSAQVFGDAQVYGNATISGHAKVYGTAEIYGKTNLSGTEEVSG